MLEDYFSLQLKFATHYAAKAAVPLDVAIDRCTNLRRRLNLWGDTGASRWKLFLNRVKSAVDNRAEQVALCAEFQQSLSYIEVKRSFGFFLTIRPMHTVPCASTLLRQMESIPVRLLLRIPAQGGPIYKN